MSKDIPKAPIKIRLYTFLRGVISVQHTAVYMIVESLLIGSLTLGAMYYFGELDVLIYAVTILSYISSSVSIYLMTDSQNRSYPTKTMNISSVKYLLLSSVFVIGVLSYGYVQEQLTIIYYVYAGVFSMYVASVLKRSQKYTGDRDYFTDQYSSAEKDWERASVALEMALDNREDSVNQSYFWAKRAESIYEGIIEKEDRVMEREAAGAFATACGFVAASVFTESNESYSLWKAAEQSIKQAKNLLSVRICDMCGQKKPVANCTGSLEDGERKIYCQECIKREQRRQRREASQQKQGGQRSGSTATNREDSNDRNRRSNRRDNEYNRDNSDGTDNRGENDKTGDRSTSRNNRRSSQKSRKSSESKNSVRSRESKSGMTVEEALDVLGLEAEPEDASGVHSAFRDKVKEAHPDMGGSEEKFRKVKKAREILVKNY